MNESILTDDVESPVYQTPILDMDLHNNRLKYDKNYAAHFKNVDNYFKMVMSIIVLIVILYLLFYAFYSKKDDIYQF